MGRRVRSDRKRDIKPTVTHELKDCVCRLAYVADKPIKDLIEIVIMEGLQRNKVIDDLSQYFLRDVRIKNTVYIGDKGRLPISRRVMGMKGVRISTRVTQSMHDSLYYLSHAMGCSVSRSTALLIDATIKDAEYIKGFMAKGESSVNRRSEMRKVLEYVNSDSV